MPVVKGQYRRPQLRNKAINYRYGWFFVTFQVFENKSELGAIVGEACVLNALGLAVKKLIETLQQFNPEVYVDCFQVMPNHVHLVIKIEDRPTNEKNHLAKIMMKLKSLAAREYRLLKERGDARDIGSHLWQANYWEKIVTSHEQLEAIRAYIANNPRRWSTDRFGPVTAYHEGNLELLNELFIAFVASQEARADALAPREWRGATPPPPEKMTPPPPDTLGERGRCPLSRCPAPNLGERGRCPLSRCPAPNLGERGRYPLSRCPAPNLGERGRCPAPVISTFTSPQEREVLRRLLNRKRRFIAVYPGGIPAVVPAAIAASVAEGRALLLSPVMSGTGVNKQRAVWCNEYVIRRAKQIWCGAIKQGGTLESILKGVLPSGQWAVARGEVPAAYPPSRRRVAERCPSRGADAKSAKVAKKRKDGRARTPVAPR